MRVPNNGTAAGIPPGVNDDRRRSRGRAARLVGALLLTLASTTLCPSPAGAAIGDISTIAGTGAAMDSGDGGPAVLAGTAGPAGAAFDADGNLYIADSTGRRVRRIDAATGTITTVAGNGVSGSGGDGGRATAAQLVTPVDVTFDGLGNLLIADYGAHTIRRVGTDGVIRTLAGTAGTPGYSGDNGPSTSALLLQPAGLDADSAGNVFVADFGNHAVRRIEVSGTITTIAGGRAGSTGDGGPARSARLRNPADVATTPDGSYFIADYGNHRIRRVDAAGIITNVAGNGIAGYAGDGGPATAASLFGPTGIEVDSVGSIFIAEYNNHTVRAVNAAGIIRTVVGRGGTAGYAGDGGSATLALLNQPARVVLDERGDFFIADLANNRVRRVVGLGVPDPPSFTRTDPASPSGVNTFLVQGTAAEGTTVRLFTDASCSPMSLVASGASSEFEGAGLPVTVPDDTTTTLHGTITDADGRNSACSIAALSYVEDSTPPPAPEITAQPASPSSAPSVQWTVQIAEGTASCTLTAPDGTTFAGPSTCGGPPSSYDLAGAPDGTYVFTAIARDAAGNASAPVSASYVRDTDAPLPPTITSRPSTPTNLSSVTWAFTGDGEPTCTLRAPDGSIVPGTSCAGGVAIYDLAGRADGTYTFAVLVTDEAGNASAAEISTVTYDTERPAAATAIESPTTPGSSSSPSWAFGLSEGVARCTLTGPDGVDVAPVDGCASGTATYELEAREDGSYRFTVVAEDAAGNISDPWTTTYVLDRVAPSTPSIVATPGGAGNDATVSWSYSSPEGSPTCALLAPDGSVVPSASAGDCTTADGAATYDLRAFEDGTYTFLVFATDAAGNPSPDASSTYALDRVAPPVPVITDTPSTPGRVRSLSWGLTSESGTLTCLLTDPMGAAVDGACGAGTAAFTIPSDRPDGTYSLSVVATDGAGNASAAATSSYVLDTVAPPAPVLESSPPSPSNDPTVRWTYSLESGTARCSLVGPSGAVPSSSCGAVAAEFDLSGLDDGPYDFTVEAVDAAGNSSSVAAPVHVLDRTAPAAPLVTAEPSTIGVPRAVEWRYTVAEGIPACSLTGPSGAATGGSGCATGVASYDLTSAEDGTYTFRVSTLDAAGNRSAVAVSPITLVTPPATTTTTSTTLPPPTTTVPPPTTTVPPPTTTTSTSTTVPPTTTTTSATTIPPTTTTLPTTTTSSPPITATTVAPTDAPAAASITDGTDPLSTLTPMATTATTRRAAGPPAPSKAAGPAGSSGPSVDDAAFVVPADPAPEPASADPGASGPAMARSPRNVGRPIGGADGTPGATTESVRALEIANTVAQKSTLPMSLLLVVVLFLLVQDRMDRNDPKLALAPVYPDPELSFGPRPRPDSRST